MKIYNLKPCARICGMCMYRSKAGRCQRATSTTYAAVVGPKYGCDQWEWDSGGPKDQAQGLPDR